MLFKLIHWVNVLKSIFGLIKFVDFILHVDKHKYKYKNKHTHIYR